MKNKHKKELKRIFEIREKTFGGQYEITIELIENLIDKIIKEERKKEQNRIQKITKEIENKTFDCFGDNCGECEVCEYKEFKEMSRVVGLPQGAEIDRNKKIEEYLKFKEKNN